MRSSVSTRLCAWLFSMALVSLVAANPVVAAESSICAESRTIIELRLPETHKAALLASLAKDDCHLEELRMLSWQFKQQDQAAAVALADAGDYVAAQQLQAAITRHPEDQSLRQTMKTIRTAHALAKLQRAAVLFQTGNPDDAKKALHEASDLEPQNERIKAAVVKMSNDYLASKIRAQAELGRYSEAMADIEASLQANQQYSADAAPRFTEFGWERKRDATLRWALRVAELLAVVAIAAWLGVRIWRRYRSRMLLILENFDNHELAPGFEQALQATFVNLGKGNSRSAAAVLGVTRPLQSIPLPAEIANALPTSVSWLQVLPDLIERIFPRRAKIVRGVLHKDSERGVGVTIHVGNGHDDNMSETFWARQYLGPKPPASAAEAADTHYPLAEYVAIWLIFKLSGADFRLLGARSWKSYAFFRAGVNAEERRDKPLAKAMYLRALGFDAQLQAARLNLALLSGEAERLLVTKFLERATQADRADATRYQARYVLASRKYDTEAGDKAAAAEIKVLLRDIEETCRLWGFKALQQEITQCLGDPASRGTTVDRAPGTTKSNDRGHEELEDYLRFIVPVAKAMWAGLTLAENNQDPCALTAIQEIASIDYSPRAYFNLACAYSLSSQGARDDEERLRLLAQSLQCMQLALWMNAAIGGKAKYDRSLHNVRTSTLILNKKTIAALFDEILQRYLQEPNALHVR